VTKFPRFTLRTSQALLDRIKRLADSQKRSMSKEIEVAIESHLKSNAHLVNEHDLNKDDG
jgi:Arc-like DNA binding domain.